MSELTKEQIENANEKLDEVIKQLVDYHTFLDNQIKLLERVDFLEAENEELYLKIIKLREKSPPKTEEFGKGTPLDFGGLSKFGFEF